jgi:small GTP-binding protein
MIQKKVCLLGTSGVGKTSLVARFVHSAFSEKYLTTVGVKIDKKIVALEGTEVTLVIWDLAGDDDFQRLQTTYLRGTSGYLLVADGTRRVTLDQALELQKRVEATLSAVPFILALNKADLAGEWEVDEARIQSLAAENFSIIRTSAKEGAGVEEAFARLARRMVQPA